MTAQAIVKEETQKGEDWIKLFDSEFESMGYTRVKNTILKKIVSSKTISRVI